MRQHKPKYKRPHREVRPQLQLPMPSPFFDEPPTEDEEDRKERSTDKRGSVEIDFTI